MCLSGATQAKPVMSEWRLLVVIYFIQPPSEQNQRAVNRLLTFVTDAVPVCGGPVMAKLEDALRLITAGA